MSKYVQVKISDKEIDDAIEKDFNYSEAIKEIVLFYIKCQCNDLQIDNILKYSSNIIDDLQDRIYNENLDDLINDSILKGRELTPEEIKMLKDNDLLDDFLKRVTERGLGKHTKKDNNE